MMYSAPPQDPSGYGQLSVEEIVFGAMEGDVNCLEWLGYPIPPAPAKQEDDCAVCASCGKRLPLAEFYRDSRKHNGHTSHCRRCMNRKRSARYHRKQANPAARK